MGLTYCHFGQPHLMVCHTAQTFTPHQEKTNMSVCRYRDSDGCTYSIQPSQTKHNLNKTQSRQRNATMLTGQDIAQHKLDIHSEYERVNIRLQFEQKKASQLELCVQRMVYLFIQVIIQEEPLKYNMLNLALVYSLSLCKTDIRSLLLGRVWRQSYYIAPASLELTMQSRLSTLSRAPGCCHQRS